MKTPRLCLMAVPLAFAGCLGPVRGPVSPTGRPSGYEIPGPQPREIPPETGVPLSTSPAAGVTPSTAPAPAAAPGGRGVFMALWTLPPKSDALAAARFLAERPRLRLSVVFPANYFGEDEKSREARALFQALVSSGQVDVVLTLPAKPVLALIMDSDNARLSTGTLVLPARFSFPEDATAQLALARSAHRRRWRQEPAGIELPWGLALGPEFPLYAKAKLRWALLPAGDEPGIEEGFSLPLVRSAALPAGSTATRENWFRDGPEKALSSRGWAGPVAAGSLEEMAFLEQATDGLAADWVPVSVVISSGLAAPGPFTGAKPDLSPWIGDSEENRAWELLGSARRAVDEFRNSGAAGIRKLDLATREMYNAESGKYFYALGADAAGAASADVRREFLATLTQVFQIMGQPVPPEVARGFSRGAPGRAAPEDESGSAFQREGDAFVWRDPPNDDRGPGNYFYPAGAQYAPGAWDLRTFRVIPRTDNVVFQFELGSLANPWKGSAGFSFPLVDLYIDINHQAGAGSQDLLPGRPGLVEPDNAWEYALTIDGWGAKLYQNAVGGPPKVVLFPAVAKAGGGLIQVAVPRSTLRGEPESWGFGLVVMGRSPSASTPMPVGVDPSPVSFGGAWPGRGAQPAPPAPPFIDILVPEGTTQRQVLGVYKAGQDVVIPFVRTE